MISLDPQVIEPLEIIEPKRAFIVVGPEGSGGYMLTEALVAAGCYWEQDFQNIDAYIDWAEKPWPLVVHRSIPHNGKFIILNDFGSEFIFAGYDVHFVFIIRDCNATAQSASRRTGCSLEKSFTNQRHALRKFGGEAQYKHFEHTYVTYEAFCLSEGFRRWLFEERLQLPYPADFEIKYANEKYYE